MDSLKISYRLNAIFLYMNTATRTHRSTTQLPRIGEAVPWFKAATPINPEFQFDTVAGRTIILCFFGSIANSLSDKTIQEFLNLRDKFDDNDLCFFAVSTDPNDQINKKIKEQLPGFHVFWDFDYKVSELYGVKSDSQFRPCTFVIDERLRLVSNHHFSEDVQQHVSAVLTSVNSLPALKPRHKADAPAPVLVVPRVFEPELCQSLIRYYQQYGGEESGFMREKNGLTVTAHDHQHKRRRDQYIEEAGLRDACMHRIHDRLAPEIKKAFQFDTTRIERHIVACYNSEDGGHFRPHRDNTTKGTAHRRFAVSLNLNTGDYDGGRLRFPEFGRQYYQPPLGGALVFSCSLLHEASPVTRGSRYVFLPFLYDDAAADIREKNLPFLEDKR